MPADPREVLEEKVADTLYGVATDPAYYNLTALNAARFAAARILALPEIAAALSAQPSGEGERERLIRAIVAGIEEDVLDRRSIKWAFEEVDPEVREEIREAWSGIIRHHLAAPTSPPASAAPADRGEALREFEERVRTHVRVEMLAKLGMETQENVAGWVALVDEARAVLSRSPA